MTDGKTQSITLEGLKQMAWDSWPFYVRLAENLEGTLAEESLVMSDEDLVKAKEILAQPVTFADMSYMSGKTAGLARRGRWPIKP